jgi:transcription elongation factor GreB
MSGERSGADGGEQPMITPEGHARLQAELTRLWREQRPRATRAVQEAAAHGDRSENAEYQYGNRQLRDIDRRIRQLSKRLESLQVVDHRGLVDERARFGAWVGLETEEGEQRCYRLVGADESDPAQGSISVDSPLGRALLGRRAGDEVSVRRPAGTAVFSVLSVRYTDPAG